MDLRAGAAGRDGPYNPRPVLPDLTLLVALVLGLYTLSAGSIEPVDPYKAMGGTAACVLVVVALCRMAADRALRALESQDGESAVSAGRWVGLWPFLGWGVVLYLFDWGAFVGETVPRTWFLLPHLLLILPLALMVGAGWVSLGRVESRVDPRGPTPWEALKRGLRRNALILIPLLVIVAIQEALIVLDALRVPGFRTLFLWSQAFPDLEAVMSLGLLSFLAFFAPELFRRTMRAQPLEDGETRREIERLCEAIGVRCKDFLVWKTGGRIVNAMVVGLTKGTRYVFVTDGLLKALPTPEVLAVVAHEAGHAKLRHLPTYFALSLAMMLLLQTAEEWLLPMLPEGSEQLFLLAFLAVFWFGILGWLSRRFERQADLFAADHVGVLLPGAGAVTLPGLPAPVPYGAAMMISALQRIVLQVGGGGHHRHGSPISRMAHIAAYSTKDTARAAQKADARRIRWGILVICLVALGTTAARLPGGLVRGEAALAFDRAVEATEAARAVAKKDGEDAARSSYVEARREFLQAAAMRKQRPADPKLQGWAARATFNAADLALRHTDQPAEARLGFEESLELLAPLSGPQSDALSFHARIDLGRLALRQGKSTEESVAAARRRLAEAQRIPENLDGDRYWGARTRLLESAIRLRDPDPVVASQARLDLTRQSVPAQPGGKAGELWEELARDAAEELRLYPPP